MKILVLGGLAGELAMLDRVMQDVGLWKPGLVLFTGDVVKGDKREVLWGARQAGKALPAGWQDRIRAELAEEIDTYGGSSRKQAASGGRYASFPATATPRSPLFSARS